MTRVLFATDLSQGADIAERLIGTIPWPPDTAFHVVTVVPFRPQLVGSPWSAVTPVDADRIETAQVRHAEAELREVVDRMAGRGQTATPRVLRGQPADAIVDLAAREHMDLVVLGCRGLGALEGALLGSVSEAVSDRAACPVLIARTEAISRSIIAHDGTKSADVATDFVRERTYLLGGVTQMITVDPVAEFSPESIGMPADAHSLQVIAADQRRLRDAAHKRAEDAAARLRAAGQDAAVEFLAGAPASTIVDAALTEAADIVVVGSRGRTGLTRLVLGSVGRFVLHHSHCSVLLVARAPAVAAAAPPHLAVPL